MVTQKSRFQNRRGTALALAEANEVPLAGEIITETDTGKIKVGDGISPYNSLEYVGDLSALSSETWTFVLDNDDETRVDKKVALWISGT